MLDGHTHFSLQKYKFHLGINSKGSYVTLIDVVSAKLFGVSSGIDYKKDCYQEAGSTPNSRLNSRL